METCKYCNGTGYIATGFKEVVESGHRALYPYTEPCFCQINFCIGKKYGMLSPVGDANPIDSEAVHNLYGDKDYIFHGSEEIFLYLVKCYFLKGFMYKNYIILEGGTIVEKYNVPKDTTGDWLTTSHLNQYDMLALLLTTTARYTSLKDCVAEVIKNRNRLSKPTWVYVRDFTTIEATREYSPDLKYYFDSYKKISLNNLDYLKGYVSRKEGMKKTESGINDSLANI
jgi:hypothetical protein